jgi:CHAT domain-containing protein
VGIIPHQILHYVPFAALSDGKAYFGEQFILFQLPSASAFPFIQDKTERALTGALILGNPKTDNPDLPPLEFAAQEAEQVADLFTTNPLLGLDASEATFRMHSGEVGVIHLAAHGGLNPAAPLFSRLWLAPGEDEDGRLNVHEIYGLNLDHAALVVLSACQTQLGEMSAGDEMISLNRAFLHGTPTVVSSLWNVDDEATGTLMTQFYTHLMDGMGKAEALSLAQEDIRTDQEHPEWNHPYYWAAFVLNGDPGTSLSSGRMDTASSTFLGVPAIWIVVALAVVFLFVALAIVWRVRRG